MERSRFHDKLEQVLRRSYRVSPTPKPHVITGDPILPPELEREIFELAAAIPNYWTKQHVGDMALVLPRVCRRAQSWIEPLIYERISLLYWFDRMPLFLATIDARPASFFAANVKYLYFDQTIGELPVVQRILSVCTGVVSLGCHHSYSSLAPLLAPLPLQRLLVSEFTPTHTADLPASLTHLGLSQTLPQDLPAAFAALPALVYFAVGVRAVPDKARMAGALTGLLRACPRIHCLVLVTCTMAQYRWARQCRPEAIDRLHVCSDGWDAWPSDIFARVGAINI